jgi:putative flippase GtrA
MENKISIEDKKISKEIIRFLITGCICAFLDFLVCYLINALLKNVISVSANGANSGVMFYQPNEFTVLQDSYAIRYKSKELNSNH